MPEWTVVIKTTWWNVVADTEDEALDKVDFLEPATEKVEVYLE